MRKLMIAAAAACCTFAAPAFADTASMTVNLTANVPNACSVQTTSAPVDFGALAPSDASGAQTAQMTFTCSTALNYTVSASSPNDDASGNHFLRNVAGGAILYRAFWGNDDSTPIPTAPGGAVGGSGINGPLTQTLRFTVPEETNPDGRNPGPYTDTLTVSINF